MADYEMEPYAYELNNTGAKLARETCDEVTAKNPSKPRFIVGARGPTNRINFPVCGRPSCEKGKLRRACGEVCFEQIGGLVDGNCGSLIVETMKQCLTP